MNKGIRAINFIIDFLAISITATIVAAIVQRPELEKTISLMVFIGYYIMFELLFGKTPGKMITKTTVVNLSGERPGLLKILLRTLLRLNPFDIISFLFGSKWGTHDVLSKTKLQKTD